MADKSLKRAGSPNIEDEEEEEFMVLTQPDPVPKPSSGKGIRIGGKKCFTQPDPVAKVSSGKAITYGGKKVARFKKKIKMSLPVEQYFSFEYVLRY